MERVRTLIDECVTICQGQNALARRIGVSSGNLSNYRAGTRAVTPEVLAQLCDIVKMPGEEARELLALVECENPKHQRSREVMRRAFFACLAVGAVLFSGASDAAASCTTVHSLYIVLCVLAVARAAALLPASRQRRGRRVPGSAGGARAESAVSWMVARQDEYRFSWRAGAA